MKNIHVLPTDKPSRLALQLDCKPNYNLQLSKIEDDWTFNWQNQNIYITSDEEIKEGDCILLPNNEIIVLPTGLSQVPLNNFIRGYSLSDCKKIILTTDQDLIKDGVQAIDDEFLKWFVKNPSCQEVEVIFFWFGGMYPCKYKIIIPKEESKQETLEEAVERLTQDYDASISHKLIAKTFITVGAKWQAERMYSEEEVKQILLKSIGQRTIFDDIGIPDWFEKFKKK